MTKEEIIDNIIYRQTDGEEYACLKKEDCMNAMQDYADQETERLKAELKVKDKEINKHLDISFALQSELNKINSKHVTEITIRNKRINDLEYKLTELKERHKGDVTKEVISFGIWFASTYNTDAMCGDDFNKRIPEIYKEYKEKFEK